MKKYFRTISIVLTLCFFISAMSACGNGFGFDPISLATLTPDSESKTSQGGIFNACAPPCWENITPGVSTEDDVIRQLDRLLREGKIKYYEKSGVVFTAEVVRGGTPLKIRLEDNVVVLIVVEDAMYPETQVDDVVQQLGEPEAYLGELKPDRDDCLCDPWNDALYEEAPSIYPNLIYSSKGLVITILVPVDTMGCICPKMRAGLFYFFPPIPLEDAFNDSDHLLVQTFDLKWEGIMQWHGYDPGY